ncbi:MAG: hypothetical protein JWN56_1645 [Sphingobacteriales bacterium]|nr:hypothetical protein [Sphingobacteriales bacterium]
MEKDITTEIISIKEKNSWNYYIQRANEYDFYHTWDYHSLEKNGKPVLIVFLHGEDFIAFPLIKRSIEGSPYYDCTSAYGYTGPISTLPFDMMDENMISAFNQAFTNYLKKEMIVTVFSRFHPLINQALLLKELGGLHFNGKTIAIDLKPSLEEIRLKYKRSVRQKVNQLRCKGFRLHRAESKFEISVFARIYNDSMQKVQASAFYFFDETYFSKFLKFENFESEIILCSYDNDVTSGILVTYSKNIMQIHLAATDNRFLQESPMKLLFDEAVAIGKARGMKFLHLGSGVGGREDSLYQFKSCFSDTSFEFITWRYVVDISTYNMLVEEKSQSQPIQSQLFPLYRFA